MHKFYFTFSLLQKPFQHCYHVIEAETEDDASETMHERFNTRWAFCYPNPEEAGIEEFKLQEIPWPIEFRSTKKAELKIYKAEKTETGWGRK